MDDGKHQTRLFAGIFFVGVAGVMVSFIISAGGLEPTGPLLHVLSSAFAG